MNSGQQPEIGWSTFTHTTLLAPRMTFFHFVLLQLPSSIVDALTDPELMDALKHANNKRTHTVGRGNSRVGGDHIRQKDPKRISMQWWKGGSSTPPKTNMEPENDGVQKEGIAFSWGLFSGAM